MKHAEVVRSFLHDRALSFVTRRADVPLLGIYMNDDTLVTTVQRFMHAWYDLVVRRSGRACRAHLTQRVIIIDSAYQTVPVITYPMLMEDKCVFGPLLCL